MDLIQVKESDQQLDKVIQSVTIDVFSGNKGFFHSVLKYTYLYIPLLTMGIISRELSSGSIKLLQSSPVTNFQIVIGKYLALLGFGLFFILVIFGIGFTASRLIDNFDWGILLAGMVGVYLLIAAYAAIGLFMSSLTSYQVVAAISTLAIFAGLNFIGEIGKGNEFVREITYWLSLQGRTDHFINGMLSSQNISYFVLVITLFLGVTIMRLNDGRVIRSELQKAVRYILLIALILSVGYFTSRPTNWHFWDLSRFEANTLTPNSKEVISHLNQKLKMKNYANILHPHGRLGTPKWRKFDLKQFDMYTRYIPEMEMEYIYYYDYVPLYADSSINLLEKAQKAALAHEIDFDQLLSPEEIKKQIDLSPERNAYVRFIHHGKDSVALRMFMDATGYPNESEITSALKRLYTKVPIVGILKGHDERSVTKIGDKAYNTITTEIGQRAALVNNGFDVKELVANQIDSLGGKLAVLVIADPFTSYSDVELAAIHRYIDQGGNLLLSIEPGKEALVNPILKNIPAKFESFQLYQKTKDLEANVLVGRAANNELSKSFYDNPNAVLSFAGSTAVRMDSNLNGYKNEELVMSGKSQVWKGRLAIDTVFQKSDSIPYILATALSKKVNDKVQKIALFADADFMSNAELGRFNLRNDNGGFTIKLFKWFSDGEFPVNTKRPESIDNKILVEAGTLNSIKYIWVFILPIVIALVGGYLLFSRKRK